MCSNYLPASLDSLLPFGRGAVGFGYGAECFPQRLAPFLANDSASWRLGVFGLMPHWAKLDLARHTYNARSETVATLPSFRAAWRRRQLAVIPVQAFGLAGIWELRRGEDGGEQWSFSMLTINADEHPVMSRFHAPGKEKRSVVMLDDAVWDDWLQARDEADVRAFLRPFDPGLMRAEADPRQGRAQGSVT